MTKPARQELSNLDYLNLILNNAEHAPSNVLLPHEEAAVKRAYEQRVESFQEIIAEKMSVTGGDDWHDGAFRATDNEARIVTESMASIAPFVGAAVVEYPTEDETRVTLGSRVMISQGKLTFPVDLVGFRSAYPDEVIDDESEEEVTAASPESPLGRAILGKQAGEEAVYKSGERTLHAKVVSVSQTAVRAYFADPNSMTIEIGAE